MGQLAAVVAATQSPTCAALRMRGLQMVRVHTPQNGFRRQRGGAVSPTSGVRRGEGADPAACEHRKNWPAEALEQAVRRYVLELLRNPEAMRRQVEQALQDEIAALRAP